MTFPRVQERCRWIARMELSLATFSGRSKTPSPWLPP